MKNIFTKKILFAAFISGLSFPFVSSPAIGTTELISNGNFGLELYYYESSFGCGEGQIDIDVEVYKDGQLIQTMSKGDRFLLTETDSINDLSFNYTADDPEFYSSYCREADGINHQILGSQDPIPNFPGAHSQLSLQAMTSGLNDYEELFLVELATRDTSSQVYDLQDVVLIIDNNPELPNSAPIALDDSASTIILSQILIDVLSNDTDADLDTKTISNVVSIDNTDANSDIGTIAIENDRLIYNAGAVPGEYSFDYTVEDGHGNSDIGTVTILVGAFPD